MSEHPTTIKAREKLREIFHSKNYVVEEEVPLETVINNMGEPIIPPYRADLVVTKSFILELDPQTSKKRKSKGHGTKHRRIHDAWRDKNIRNQIDLKTVRLIPAEVLKMNDKEIIDEINYQLKTKK